MSNSNPTPGIDPSALDTWLTGRLQGGQPPFVYQLIVGGHSNITCRLTDVNGASFVLRRPPLGLQPPGAHDVAREYRILAALQHTAVPVPRVELLCEDSSVIGAPFYLMRWVDGEVIDSPSQVVKVLSTPVLRISAAADVIGTLGDLHQLDVDALGLGSLGQRENFVPRQIARMWRVWQKIKTRELPLIDALHDRLIAQCPSQIYTGLVHNDYRLGNLILNYQGTVEAVLDWELTAIGDVLVDVGGLLNNWEGPDDTIPDVWMQTSPTRAGGFPNRDAMAALYAQRMGIAVPRLDYYRALSYWRIAIIGEGMMRRYASGDLPANIKVVEILERKVCERAALADSFLEMAMNL